MPTYEYACRECGKHIEVQQAFTDNALTTCPTCEGPLRKVFGNIAISFKGSGFYSTDNRSMGKAGATSGKADGDGHAGGTDASSKSESSSDGSKDGSSKSESATSSGTESKSGGESKPATSTDSGSKAGEKSTATAS